MKTTEKMNLREECIPKSKYKHIYGIDLGTTNSCISLFTGGEKTTIQLCNGKRTMPSCGMWDSKTDTFVIGEEAKKNKGETNVFFSVKRLMGTDAVINLEHNGANKAITPVEASSLILKGLVEQASTLHKDIKNVVVTVPARFNNKQIEDTKKAAEMAGLNVIKMLKEPTSAALAYGLDRSEEKSETALIYDLGGGTFDVSLVQINKNKFTEEDVAFLKAYYDLTREDTGLDDESTSINVLKTHGNTALGGDDIDHYLLDIVLDKLAEAGVKIDQIPTSERIRLLTECENAKIIGGEDIVISVPVNFQPVGTNKKSDYVSTVIDITSDMIETAIRKVYNETKKVIKENITAVELSHIKHIILIGGSTKSEILKKLLKRDFAGVPINDRLNPDLLVCLGAGVEGYRHVDGKNNMTVNDIIPMSIGVLANRQVAPVISRYTRIPTSCNRKFTTTQDNQPFISIQIYEGDSLFPEACTCLGSLEINDIALGKAGSVFIDVQLAIDSDGLLVCSVKVGDIYVRKELTNVLGGKDSSDKTELSYQEKSVLKWKAFAEDRIKPVNERDYDSFIQLLSAYVVKLQKLGSGSEEMKSEFVKLKAEALSYVKKYK